jgi:hypothetical protein
MQKPRNAPPYRYVAFTAECNGTPVTSFAPSTLRINEANVQVTDYLILPPDTSLGVHQRICVMVDMSANLPASLLSSVRAALHAFIDTLQPGDEAEISWYGRGAGVEQAMTSDTALLHSAVNTMPSVASSPISTFRFFDQRVHALARDSNHCGSVIVLNGSVDTSGWYDDARRYALNDSAWIAVHALLHAEVSAYNRHFVSLANMSKGYLNPIVLQSALPGELRAAYRLQRRNNRGTFHTLRVPYTQYRCDRWTPNVQIILSGCGPNKWDMEEVPDWFDSTHITNITFGASSPTAYGSCIADIDLLVEQESMTPLRIGSEFITVQYDTSRLRLLANPTVGTLLAKKGPVIWPNQGADGFSFSFEMTDTVRYNGTLAHCRFLVAATDTSHFDTIRVLRNGYSSSCYVAHSVPGVVSVHPKRAAPQAGFAWPALTQVAGEEAVLPLYVNVADSNALDAEPASLRVFFSQVSTACLGIEAKQGTLFADGKIMYEPSRGGGLLRFAPGCHITHSGILCYLRFRPVNAKDTAMITVSVGEADFISGCAWPTYSKGAIRFNQQSSAVTSPQMPESPIAAVALYPHPATDRSTLHLELRRAAEVRISLVTLSGQELAVLAHGPRAAGSHEITIDASASATGPLFLRIDVDARQSRVLPVLWGNRE